MAESAGGEDPRDEPADARAGVGSPSDVLMTWIGLAVICIVAAAWVSAASETARVWMLEHKWWLIGGYVALGLLLALASKVPVLRDRLLSLSETGKSTILMFVLIPALVLSVLAVPFIDERYRSAVIHAVFILLVCLLPGVMYYLFIVSRRPSMLNEYVANLRRLGLIGPRSFDGTEPSALRHRRVESYLQRFESVYGTIGDRRAALIEELSQPGEPSGNFSAGALAYGRTNPTDLANVFPREVFVQMFLTTLLMALGWLLVLPPQIMQHEFVGPRLGASVLAGNGSMVPALSPVNTAFLGAYFFTLQMVFRRFVRRDLNVKVYVNTSMRIVLAVIAAWMAAILWAIAVPGGELNAYGLLLSGFDTTTPADTGLLALTFALGAFPHMLWQMLGAWIKSVPFVKGAMPSLEAGRPLSELGGMTVWHESRMEEEDVENVENMATADPLDLMLHTRLPPERLMRWIDESMLLNGLGSPSLETDAAPTGVRGRFARIGLLTATDLYVTVGRCEQSSVAGLGDDDSLRACNLVRTLAAKASNFSLLLAWYGLDVSPCSKPDGQPAAVPDEAPRPPRPAIKSRDVAAA